MGKKEVKLTPIPKLIENLDFDQIDPFDFATALYSYNNQSIFEPLRCEIPKEDFWKFFTTIPDSVEKSITPLMTVELLDYIRVKVLNANGFTTQDGYYFDKDNIENVNSFLL